MTKLQSLLKQIKTGSIDSTALVPKPQISVEELRKHEFMEILKLGYWPIKILQQQRHWLCQGEPMDDGWMTSLDPEDNICVYQFSSTIGDSIIIDLTIAQGNVLDIDGHTQLMFRIYNIDTQDNLGEKIYNITSMEQIDHAIDQDWQAFIDLNWPAVIENYNKVLNKYDNHCENQDAEIHLKFTKFAWVEFNQRLRTQLGMLIFDDWNAMDVVEDWITGTVRQPPKPIQDK
jgi:hypothetical protein